MVRSRRDRCRGGRPATLAGLPEQRARLHRARAQAFITQAAPGRKLAPNLAKRGMRAEFSVAPDMTLTVYNMEDPVVGGYTPDKVALRRALSLATTCAREIRISRRGTAVPAQARWCLTAWPSTRT